MSEEIQLVAPHGRVFYWLVVFFGAVGALFFAAVALTRGTDTALGWRVAFLGASGVLFVGVALAGERVVRPERAMTRAVGLSEAVRRRMDWGRFVALFVAVGGYGVLSVVRRYSSWEVRDVCDDLRILVLTLLALGFCLADAAGRRVFAVGTMFARRPPPPKRHRMRRSGLTVPTRPR